MLMLTAARQLFAAQGFDVTTIAEIAERADVAIGSFYNYFRTKDELLEALLEEVLSEQGERVEALQSGVEDPAEAISVAHRHFVGLVASEPEWAWLLVRMEVPLRVANTALGAAARRDIRRGIGTGRFRLVNPELALQASGGALIAVMHGRLIGELGEGAASEHAEGVLRSLGLSPEEAAEIARRPMPRDPEPA
jgi:AcrR family transcriptional regulator